MSAVKDFSKARVSGPEEWRVIREAYAETYPVRPLLNRIDELEWVLEQVRREITAVTPSWSRVFRMFDEANLGPALKASAEQSS